MMGDRQVMQEALFYDVSIERLVPEDHLLRVIDRYLDLEGIREELKPFYAAEGRPSVDPELMIRMLVAGYCYGIRSERRLCEEVGLNLAYRWFCRLSLTDPVPDHSTFSKNRHGLRRSPSLTAIRAKSLSRSGRATQTMTHRAQTTGSKTAAPPSAYVARAMSQSVRPA